MGAYSSSNEGTSLPCHGPASRKARGHAPHKMNADQEKDHLQDSIRCSGSAFPALEAYPAVEQPAKHMVAFTETTWCSDSMWTTITDTATMI